MKNLAPSTPVLSHWRYTKTAVVLHWLSALLLLAIAALGWYMMAIEDEPGSAGYFSLHKSLGLVFTLLFVARVGWRLSHRPAALPASVPQWQARLASGTQALLYILMVLMPVTGYLGAAHSKKGVQLFGLELPRWTLPNHDTAEQFFDLHSALIWVLAGLIVIHVLGALKHLLLDKDGVFQRIWFKS